MAADALDWRAGECYNNECLQATAKHGGGWVCFSANGFGDLFRIKGVLNAEKYRQILIHHAVPSGRRLTGPRFILQQDNEPKHRANVIRNYLQRKDKQGVLEVMVRPPQSPDLNIIWSVWNDKKRQKDLRQPTSTSICGDFSKMFGTTYLPSSFKNCVQVYKKNWCCFEGKGWSHQISIWFRIFFFFLHFVNWWK